MAHATDARSISGMVRLPKTWPPGVGKRGNQQLAAIENTLDLEAHELVLALGQRLGGLDAFLLYECVNTCSKSRIADSDEAPGLHQTDARRHMRGAQQAPNQRFVERLGRKWRMSRRMAITR